MRSESIEKVYPKKTLRSITEIVRQVRPNGFLLIYFRRCLKTPLTLTLKKNRVFCRYVRTAAMLRK